MCEDGFRCDEEADACALDCTTHGDRDGDGHRAADCGGDDCDDAGGDVHPGAVERCNGLDDDCDGTVDGAAAAPSCGAAPHTTYACIDAACRIAACDPEWDDCNGALDDGCEIDLSGDRVNCGACGHACWFSCLDAVCDDLVDISLDHDSSCGLTASGRVSCWGENRAYGLGNGTTTSTGEPVLATRVGGAMAVAPGIDFSCALMADGTVQCWGGNARGGLGDGVASHGHRCPAYAAGGTWDCSDAPVTVIGISNAVEIDAGGSYACARLADGRVLCWGLDDSLLGDGFAPHPSTCAVSGSADCSSVPMEVAGITDAVQISAGPRGACVRTSSGAVQCWGLNDYGDVGDGTTSRRHAPVPVVGITDAVDVSSGDGVRCAVRSDGTVACWGSDHYQALGDGAAITHPTRGPWSVPCSTTPVTVVGIDDAVAVHAGAAFACALRATGQVACWGLGSHIGGGTTVYGTACGSSGGQDCAATPVLLSGLGAVSTLPRDAWVNSCVIETSGRVMCWGRGDGGGLGLGWMDGSVPRPLLPLGP